MIHIITVLRSRMILIGLLKSWHNQLLPVHMPLSFVHQAEWLPSCSKQMTVTFWWWHHWSNSDTNCVRGGGLRHNLARAYDSAIDKIPRCLTSNIITNQSRSSAKQLGSHSAWWSCQDRQWHVCTWQGKHTSILWINEIIDNNYTLSLLSSSTLPLTLSMNSISCNCTG